MAVDIQTVIKTVREPLRSYNFEVILPAEFGNSERLRYMVRSVDLPSFFNLETEKVEVAPGFEIEYPAGFRKDDRVSLEFWEDEDLSVYEYFLKWRGRIVDLEYGSATLMNFARRRDYVRSFDVYLLNIRNERVKKVKIMEAFPVGVERFSFSYSESNVVTVRVDFCCTEIKVE